MLNTSVNAGYWNFYTVWEKKHKSVSVTFGMLPYIQAKKTKTAFAIQLNNVVLCFNYCILMMKDDFRPRISNDYKQDAALYMFEIEV